MVAIITFLINAKKGWVVSRKYKDMYKEEYSGLKGINVDFQKKTPLPEGGMGISVTLYGNSGITYEYLRKIQKVIQDKVEQSLQYDLEKEQRNSDERYRRTVRSWERAEDRLASKQESLNQKSQTFSNDVNKTNSRFGGLEVEEIQEPTPAEMAKKAEIEARKAKIEADKAKAEADFKKRNNHFSVTFAQLVKPKTNDEPEVTVNKKTRPPQVDKTVSVLTEVLPGDALSLIPHAKKNSELAKKQAHDAWLERKAKKETQKATIEKQTVQTSSVRIVGSWFDDMEANE